MSDEKALKARVFGRVQGVSFRAWTRETASTLGLAGWVRNESDGSVLALLRGPVPQVEAMLARLHEGPEAAQVDTVDTYEVDLDRTAPLGFEILR